MSLLWLSAQSEGPAQGLAYAPLGTLGAPRRPGQREDLTCQVCLIGPGAHLTATVIGKLAGLMWMHVIRLFSTRWEMALTAGRHCVTAGRRPPNEIASSGLVLPNFR